MVGRIVLGLAVAVLTLGFCIGAMAAPRDASSIAAVFPPWWSPAQAAAAAASAGQIAGAGRGSIVIVTSPAPGLSDRLRRAGALLLLGPGLAGQCAQPVSKASA